MILKTEKIIKEWTDYNEHMNVAYYIHVFDIAADIMLDNFKPTQIKKAITVLKNQKLRNKVLLEASGGINSKNISAYGKTGVDIISVGSITNSVKGIDMSLEV